MIPCQEFVDQAPDALVLSVTQELDMDQFQVLARESANVGGIQVELNVIGASHIIALKGCSGTLHEVVACTNLPNGQAIAAINAPVVRRFDGINYTFHVAFFPWQDPEPLVLWDIVRKAKTAHMLGGLGVVYEFPQGELAATPKTVLLAYPHIKDGLGAMFYTAHSYPGKGVVISHSTVRQA